MFDTTEPSCEALTPRVPSLMEGLEQRRLRAQNDLDKVNEAIEALRKNPEIAIVIEKISKIRGL